MQWWREGGVLVTRIQCRFTVTSGFKLQTHEHHSLSSRSAQPVGLFQNSQCYHNSLIDVAEIVRHFQTLGNIYFPEK